jgi:hypothetical protein
MSNEHALLNCTFGWGKTCRLYYDSIEVAGKSYDLKDLTSIHPSYRIVLGIPSARLELSFGLNRLVLRGIADPGIARLMVSHLQPYCSTTPHTAQARSRSSRARNLARAQARAWEPTNKLPAILNSPANAPRALSADDAPTYSNTASDKSTFAEEQPTDEPISLAAVPKAPVEDTSLTPSETLEAFAQLASNLSTYASPLPTTLWQPPHTPRFQPPLHSVHLIPPDQKFDSNSIPVPSVKSSVLPIIHVPVRLQHGECAHYSIGATLCSDRISNSARATYPLRDQGLLILTNRRVLYIGKRCQFTLAYSHLWYVSLLRTAIALHIEGQFRRIIIELEHAHEWASRIELLAFIARRARPEPPTVSVAAVPGLNMTVKRKAVKPCAAKGRISANNTTVPLLPERVSSRIVEAETIEISDAAVQACADHKTLDFPSAPSSPETVEAAKDSVSAIADQPTRTDMTMHKVSQPLRLENVPTQEFPGQPDVATLATREFSLQSPQPEAENASAQTISPDSDVANMATREFSLQPACNQQELFDQPYVQEKMTQGLQLEQEEIARLQAAQPPEQKREVTTSALYDPNLDPALPLAALAESDAPPIQGPADPEDDDRTIHLHDRKLSQLRTVSLHEPISDRLPDLEPVKRRAPRVRAPQ